MTPCTSAQERPSHTLLPQRIAPLSTRGACAQVLALKRMMRPKAATNRSGTLEFASPKIYEDGAIDQYVADNTGLMTITHAMTHATGSHSNAEHEHHRLFGLAGEGCAR